MKIFSQITLTLLFVAGSIGALAQTKAPVAWWKFDEGSGTVTKDTASGHTDNILNNSQWVRGISGSGLKFDGFTTVIERAPEDVPQLANHFTVEAWVALQSYPWNWLAIVDQEKARHSGYYFGIDAEGHLGLQLSVWSTWETCISQTRIPLKKWVHIVGTYDSSTGIALYIDGKPAGKLALTGRMDAAPKTGMRIGRNFEDLPPTAIVRLSAAIPAFSSLDGILDELKIYDRALDEQEISSTYEQTKPSDAPTLAERHWPVLPATKRFGAVYTELKLYPEWDALWRSGPYSDVVVGFADQPFHYVFWRGANFGEGMVTENGIWIGDQSFESGTKVGTAEHMNDKHNMTSHISIVENTDARVVLHWRYALVDVVEKISSVDPLTGWGDWADEYFYIYPDGVAVRYGTIHGTRKQYSFTEPTLLIEPGKKPEDYISLQAATIANNKGEGRTYSWDPVSPPFPFPNQPADANIAILNLNSEYKPFYVYQPGTELGPYGWPPELRPEYSHFPVWDHWPVNQAPTDGRYAMYPDRFASAAVMSPDPNHAWVEGPGPTKSSYFLFGLGKQSTSDLAALDRSWLQPAAVKVSSKGFTGTFDPAQKAYILSRTESNSNQKLDFTLEASEQSPLVNPAFLIKDWGERASNITFGGKTLSPDEVKTGFNHRLDGTDLVIWVKATSMKPVTVSIGR
ncbi:MAG: LamG domain-containing protein [Acidobacteria bacterium]|nr:LamG domain-containing protein [Acidobacteriota bacterium]